MARRQHMIAELGNSPRLSGAVLVGKGVSPSPGAGVRRDSELDLIKDHLGWESPPHTKLFPFSLVRPPHMPLPPSPHGSDYGSRVGVVGQRRERESYIHLFSAAACTTQDLFEADSACSRERGRGGREREGGKGRERSYPSGTLSACPSTCHNTFQAQVARAFSKSSSSPFAKQASPGTQGMGVTSTSLEPLCPSRR